MDNSFKLKFNSNHSIIQELINYLLSNFDNLKNEEQIEKLKALSFVLYENGSYCEKVFL